MILNSITEVILGIIAINFNTDLIFEFILKLMLF